MTKIEELRNHILNATCSGDLPDTTLATFDDMVEAVEALKDMRELSLEMGSAIRYFDDDDQYLGYWYNDGDYLIDERFGKAGRILGNLR